MAAALNNRSRLRAGLFTIVASGVAAAWSSVVLSGTKTGAALPALIATGPVLLYAALIAPLAFPFGLYVAAAPFDEILTVSSFGTLERIVGIATALALVLYMLRTKRFLDPSKWVLPWIVLYFWMGASLFWAMDANQSSQALTTALELFALYIVVSMFPLTFRQLEGVAYVVIAGGVAAAFYAIILFTNGVSIQNRLALSDINASGDPNHFAASMLLPLAMALYIFMWHRSNAVRTLVLGAGGVLVAAIMLSGSRGAIVGAIALVVFLIARDPNRKTLAVVAGVLAVVAGIAAGPSIGARFMEASVNGGAGRADIWHVGWVAFQHNWLIGAGYNNFADAYDKAYISVFQPFYTNWHRAAHNLLLQTAVELGIVGVVLVVLAWVGQYRMLSFIRPGDQRFGLRVALQASVVALFVVAMFSDIMDRKYLWLLFLLIALTRNTRTEPLKQNA